MFRVTPVVITEHMRYNKNENICLLTATQS